MTTAEDRAAELFEQRPSAQPPLAREYADHLRRRYAGCSEVLIAAYTAYAHCVEGLPLRHPGDVDDEARGWFSVRRPNSMVAAPRVSRP